MNQQPERFLQLDDVKRRAGLGKSMIYWLIQGGRFFHTFPVFGCCVRWSERELVASIDKVRDGFELEPVESDRSAAFGSTRR